MADKVIIYTDGACSGNPGLGGWGALLIYKGVEKQLSGSFEEATNNQMELIATIEALKALKRKCNVILYTDSIYVKDGITKWIHKWKQNNWKTANKKPVKNVDMWRELDGLANEHEIEWVWVKAHDGNDGNERVDKLARDSVKDLKLGLNKTVE